MTRSDKHGPRIDEDLAQDFEDDQRAGRPTRRGEWRDPEPPTDPTGDAAGIATEDPELPEMVPGGDQSSSNQSRPDEYAGDERSEPPPPA